ncbi:acyltransferase [Kineosporia succinea]|uniref:Acetyltransferase-like isoleucine patch superfamily enzyme n=1 Tax=Kineosporia succinea TaxID=84632 RepID=A0ABT9NWX9_9ACTN|nr:acyltransferase [Kineosporia succinea]MDP9824935.1 acetyltransferase-like isoleucine patch superfamily enzyme [Kineosporia succinea]
MAELQLEVQGEDHDIQISPEARLAGSKIKIRNNGGPCSVHIGAGVSGKWSISVAGGAKVVIGENSTCESAMLVAHSAGITIGEDCMFSFSVEIRDTDTHAIYDIDSGERINPDKPIVLGDHVWLGKQVMILKGANVGAGVIVGARAVVSGKVPPLSVAAGIPARIVRQNVVWTRRIGKGQLDLDPAAMAVVASVRDIEGVPGD